MEKDGIRIMIIVKKLNNNVVISLDENSNEIVVFGKGIAFDKKVGDNIQQEQIEKIFVNNEGDASDRLQKLLVGISPRYLEVCNKIIEDAKKVLNKNIDDSIFSALTDHINMAVKRYLNGVMVPNIMLLDIRRFYSEEYKVGLRALNIIKQELKVELPEDEAGFIAFHIVNATQDSDYTNMNKVMKIVKEICNIVKYYIVIDIDEDSFYYQRFLTHLKFFSQRLLTNQDFEEHPSNPLFQVVKQQYSKSYQCTTKIAEFIKTKYQKDIFEEEKLYLTVHIQNLIDRYK